MNLDDKLPMLLEDQEYLASLQDKKDSDKVQVTSVLYKGFITFSNNRWIKCDHWTFLRFDETVESEGDFEDDLREGKWLFYHWSQKKDEKVLFAEGNYKRGKKVGKWKFYDEDEKLESEYSFEDNVLSGEAVCYYSFVDNISFRGNYIKGKRQVVWKVIDNEGNLLSKKLYDDDIVIDEIC